MSTNEQKAIELGKSQARVTKELKEAKSCLLRSVKEKFGKGRISGHQYVGDDGSVLIWQLRKFPNEPESYENQQTNRGTVAFYFADEVKRVGTIIHNALDKF